MNQKKVLPIILLMLLISSSCNMLGDQETFPPSISSKVKKEIDANLEKTVSQSPLAGLSLALQVDREPYYTQSYGMANIETGRAVDKETIFQVGSITKTFTSASILQLVEKGKIRLDESISTYIDELPSEADDILVLHLLSHTSGLPNLEETNIRIDYEYSYTPDEVIQILIDEFPELRFEPGSQFHYSNLGYFLLGFIIEEITGLSYYDYLEVNILEPLDMKSISPCIDVGGSIARGYKVSGEELVPADPTNLTLAYAAGGLCSNAQDLLKWYENLSSGNVVGMDEFEDMTSPVLLPDGTQLESGLGFIVGDFLGEEAIGHIGRTSGYESFLTHFPDKELTIVIVSNTNPKDPYVISNLIASIKDSIGY